VPPDDCWSTPTLEIDFDKKGNVDYMKLATSYLCGLSIYD